MQDNPLSDVPRDVMLNELGNSQLLGGYMQSNEQINPSQFQDAAMYPYQVTDDFLFGVSPQDSIPFGFVGDEIEGFKNYVGDSPIQDSISFGFVGGEIDGFQNYVGDFGSLKAAGGAPEPFLADCELSKNFEGARKHILGDCELERVVEGAHEQVLGDCELEKVVGGAQERVLGDCESSNAVGGAHEHVLGACEWLKAVGGAHDHLDAGIAVGNICGQETNWSYKMVKLLVTAVSYLGQGHLLSYTTKSKWEAIYEVMVQRGYTVSPQQCYNKFEDLKNKNGRFHAILGKDACDVYKNPILLESMDLPDEAKMEVRNLIFGKQLFYEEMWSCLNENRTFLPHDFPLIRSLTGALRTKLLSGSKMLSQGPSVKRKRLSEDSSSKSLATPSNGNASSGEGAKANKELLLMVQEQKAELLAERLGFEKEKIKWVRYNINLEWEVKQVRLQNEFLKLENERLALELQTKNIAP